MDFIVITATNTFDIETKCQVVGGVQTYTHDLCHLALEKGYHPIIYQLDQKRDDADACFDGIEFHIFHKRSSDNQKVFNTIYRKYAKDSLFVIASDQLDIKTKAKNVIVIQHGVAFDLPITYGFWSKLKVLQHLNKLIRSLNNVRRLYWSANTVGVDYNYFNWFRTLGMFYPGKRFTIIPNYSSGHISENEFERKMKGHNDKGELSIVFARRFSDYRGTLLFANCVDKLLNKYSGLTVTFAGEGVLKGELVRRYKNNPRVTITSFTASQSIEFHKKYDIAIVPTVYSEGTSLSLLEAMSAGCFPIATHVGGMTNIILDHYNGLLCFPDEIGVYRAIEEAITMDIVHFKAMAKNAYNSAIESFSIDLWKSRWSAFLDEVVEDCKS